MVKPLLGESMVDRAVLITDARPSADDELSARKKRYVIMMLMRIPFLIAAAMTYEIPWLAITLILLSIPLPWMAVLLANDGPARRGRRSRVLPGTISPDRALEKPHSVIEAEDHRAPSEGGSDASGWNASDGGGSERAAAS